MCKNKTPPAAMGSENDSELTNVGGASSRIRLRKVSRLGNVTATVRRAYADREVVETAWTNGTTIATTYRNGAAVLREEWPDGRWRETVTSSSYDADGCRVDAVTVAAADHGAVTVRTTRRDFLGRTVRETTPTSDVAYAYDGAGSRVLTATDSKSGETVVRLYNALGEAVGRMRNGVASVSETGYEVGSNALWRVSWQVVSGSVTNASSVVKERLTGLSDGLRGETVAYHNGALSVHSRSSFDATNSVLTEVFESAASGTAVTRSKFGIVFEETKPGGTVRSFFDPYGRVFYTERDGRSADCIGRNDFGDVVEYDVFHARGADVHAEFYGYDTVGNRIAATNALGAVTVCAYDAAGRLASSGGAVHPVRYGYDTGGRRTSLATTRDGAAWDATAWTRDPATGLCSTKTYADGSTVAYTYTPDGRPLRTTCASGRWRENSYGGRRELVSTEYSDGEVCAFAYDEFSREIAASNAVASVVFARDDYGQITNETTGVAGETRSLDRGYDAYGRIIRNDGSVYAYDSAGRLASVSNAIAVAEYRYTGDGYDAGYSITLPNGVVFTRRVARDGYRRPLITGITNSVSGIAVENFAYAYDALNRPISRNADTFGYNDRSEVTNATVAGKSDSYGYNEIGNSTDWMANSLNQYAQFAYDPDGNLLSDGIRTFAYDAANRLRTVSTNGIPILSNSYDAKSRRVRKVTPEATTTFFYDDWNLIEERIAHTGGAMSTIYYCWGRDLSGTPQGAGGVGGLLYLTVDGVIYIPCYDANGNVTRYLDADGSTVAAYTYDAFGKLIAATGPLADLFRHRFSTKYFDAETSLSYYGYRFYHPVLMRWLNRDPIEEEGGDNLYLFCNNSSTRVIDSDGRWTWSEESAINELHGKIREMRENGYNFAADAIAHYIGNHSSNIDLSRYASQIYNDSGWQQSFIGSVVAELRKKDPSGTNKKVEIGDIEHKASFSGGLQTGRIDGLFRQMFSHRFQPYHDMGLFYALYGSHYSYVGTASWCKKSEHNFLSIDFQTDITMDLEVVSWDPLSYGGSGIRDIAPSYSAARYLQDIHGYRKNFIYLKWKEKGAWRVTTSSSTRGSYTNTQRRSIK